MSRNILIVPSSCTILSISFYMLEGQLKPGHQLNITLSVSSVDISDTLASGIRSTCWPGKFAPRVRREGLKGP